MPKPNKRGKDSNDINGHANSQSKAELGSQGQMGSLNRQNETVLTNSVPKCSGASSSDSELDYRLTN